MRSVSDLSRLWDDAITQVSPDYWKWPNRDNPASYLSRVAASDAIGAGLLVAHLGDRLHPGAA